MELTQRIALRAAARVRQQLVARRGLQGDVYLPHNIWSQAVNRLNQHDRARHLGWQRAAASLSEDLEFDLHCLRRQIEHVLDVLHKRAHLQPIPSQAELLREILALEQEFDEIELDLKQGHLSVVTQEIVLSDIDLGPFEIRLELNHLGDTPCYRVIAQDPNPAASDSSVTHPHVQDGHLCEGDGHLAIQMALSEGRLVDFFLMVSRLLATYSQGRAYVELNRWTGFSCSDCGESVRESSAGSCPSCDAWLCEECRTCCHDCQLEFCLECLRICPGCQNAFCGGCLSNCHGCQTNVCRQCLVGNQCPGCRKNRPSTQKVHHAPICQLNAEPVAA